MKLQVKIFVVLAIIAIAIESNKSFCFGGNGGEEMTFVCPGGKIEKIHGTTTIHGWIGSLGATCSYGKHLVRFPWPNEDIISVGNSRGNYFQAASPSGFKGVKYRAGEFVDQLQFVSNTGEITQAYGGQGGSDIGEILCPHGQSIIGFKIRYGQYIDNLEPICGQ